MYAYRCVCTINACKKRACLSARERLYGVLHELQSFVWRVNFEGKKERSHTNESCLIRTKPSKPQPFYLLIPTRCNNIAFYCCYSVLCRFCQSLCKREKEKYLHLLLSYRPYTPLTSINLRSARHTLFTLFLSLSLSLSLSILFLSVSVGLMCTSNDVTIRVRIYYTNAAACGQVAAIFFSVALQMCRTSKSADKNLLSE